MGTVFEARDRRHGSRLALKVLHDANGEALAGLRREFRALRDLSHPNLVTMYELHVEHDVPFIAMELIYGSSLQRQLQTQHSPVGVALLKQAAELADHPAPRLSTLRSRRLLRTVIHDGEPQLLPHHDRVREAVIAALSQAQRRARHARLARAAEAIGFDDSEFLADQHAHAGQLAEAAVYAERAGDRARDAMALQRARVDSGAYTSLDACEAPSKSGPTWVPCGTMALVANDSPDVRTIAHCMIDQLETRIGCLSMSGCESQAVSQCDTNALTCAAGQPQLIAKLIETCPDLGLLSRL